MSAPRISRTGSPFDRRLLRAARAEGPTDGAERRALAALALRSGLDGRESTIASTGGASAIRWGKAGVLWVGLAVAIGGAFAAADAERPSMERGAVHGVVDGAAAANWAVSSPPSPIVSVTPADVDVPASSPAPVTVSPPVHPRASPARVVASEVDLVQGAARALASNQPRVASDLLDGYFRSFPGGVLAREAGLLRVRALMGLGDTATASRLARTMLRDDARDLLAGPLREALDAATRRNPAGATRGP
jgi:hypothetical protein